MASWLDQFPPDRKAGLDREPPPRRGESRSPYLDDLMKADARMTIDLHGLTGQEAETLLIGELRSAWKRGFRKIRIIHGKGLHSQNDAVLPKVVSKILNRTEFVLKHGKESPDKGGDGATWVIFKGSGAV